MAILIVIMTFHALTLPNRIYTYTRIGTFSWVQTSRVILETSFVTPEELEKKGGHFFNAGGGNTACKVDKELCASINKKIAANSIEKSEIRKNVLLTFAKHPFKWTYLKMSLMPNYWFVSLNSFLDLVYSAHPDYTTTDNFVFLLCFIFTVIYSIISLRSFMSTVIFWFGSSLIIAYAGIFTFAQLEVRYLLFFKFYFLTTSILYLAEMTAKPCYKFFFTASDRRNISSTP